MSFEGHRCLKGQTELRSVWSSSNFVWLYNAFPEFGMYLLSEIIDAFPVCNRLTKPLVYNNNGFFSKTIFASLNANKPSLSFHTSFDEYNLFSRSQISDHPNKTKQWKLHFLVLRVDWAFAPLVCQFVLLGYITIQFVSANTCQYYPPLLHPPLHVREQHSPVHCWYIACWWYS